MYIIIDAPGYTDNRARVYSRHATLANARKSLRKHYIHPPGNSRQMSAMIVERESSKGEDYVFLSGIRDAGYTIYGIE